MATKPEKKTSKSSSISEAPIATVLSMIEKCLGTKSMEFITVSDHKSGTVVTACVPGSSAVSLYNGKLITSSEETSRGEVSSAYHIPYQAFKDAISKRKAPVMNIDNNDTLIIEEGKTRVEVSLREAAQVPEVPKFPSSENSFEITPDVLTSMKDILPFLVLEKIAPTQPDPRFYVNSSDGKVFVAVYDFAQVVYSTFKSEGFPDIDLNGPYGIIAPLFKDSLPGTKVCLEDDTLYLSFLKTRSATNIIPLASYESTGESIKENCLSMRKRLKDEALSEIPLSKEFLDDFLSTAKSVTTEDTRASFEVVDNVLTITASSSSGKISTETEVKSEDLKFNLELKVLRTISSKVGDTFSIIVDQENDLCIIKGSVTTYLAVFSTDD